MNKLISEKSPYLLQHAHNPVDWHAWGSGAFEKARLEDKPIFLSIGYSTCHWCHVMERESFESAEIAAILNADFVSIKVDREERPDVDRIYMAFVQASTGGGGWPMSVFLTPDLKPFFGGTYFPPDTRYGRPGFPNILASLARAWKEDRARIVESSEDVVRQLQTYGRVAAESHTNFDRPLLDSGFYQYRRSFDSRHGGFGSAPKFPRAVTHNFLLRYSIFAKNEEAAEMVLFTLRAMARGGMNDQLAGGFHRYSVDDRWFVPHFEKMLYDQAQLAISYLEGFQISGDAELANVARTIFDYVLRDMTHADGGFYCAEDADSVVDRAKPDEKSEGAFYVWRYGEIKSILGEPLTSKFAQHYGVRERGNVDEDPHGEFTGKNILFVAKEGGVGPEIEEANKKLLAERNKRVRPHLDDKILTAWNGLMISAFAKGAQVLGDERYLSAARRGADFILAEMFNGTTLLRRFRDGEAGIAGFLDDYAFFAQALLDLYEASFEFQYLKAARTLTDRMIELFVDLEDGGFFSSAAGDESLVIRMKEDYDGAEPSGNSIAALNLLRMAHLTGSERYGELASKTLDAFGSRVKTTPSGVPQMMVAVMYSLTPPKQIVLAGSADAPETRAMLEAIRARFLPWHALLLVDGDEIRSLNPALHEMKPAGGKTAAYVCENFTCQLPVTNLDNLNGLLK